jgi:addiction module RelE/StbE family toxin
LNEVIWTEAALANVRAIRAYIEQFNPAAARKLAGALVAAGDSLRHSPHRGRPVRNTDMRELVTSYPYIIRYSVIDDTVVILRVRHTSRRPTNP